MKAILFDLYGVLMRPQSPAGQREIEALAGVGGIGFWKAYWLHRPEYEAGLSGREYWRRVGVTVGSPIDRTRAVIRADVASWSRPNDDMVGYVRSLARMPIRLGLLANVPLDLALAVEIDQQEWLRLFDAVTWSCRHGFTKPRGDAYMIARRKLHTPAADILVVDDRAENLVPAAALGMRTHLFTSRALLEPVISAHVDG